MDCLRLGTTRRGSDVSESLRRQRGEALGGLHFCVWLGAVSSFVGVGPRHMGAKHLKWQEAWEEGGALGGLDILGEPYMFLNLL